MAIITLTSDFGLRDGYVAAMKGAILSVNPEARLVDISHAVEPQNVQQAAYIVSMAYPYFPRGSVHLVVVDPGVGTDRRAVIVRTDSADFVAPDNGVLSYALHPFLIQPDEQGTPRETGFRAGIEAYAINNPVYWRRPVSDTFHGRDIFGPVAAHLSLGVAPGVLGDRIDSLVALPLLQPAREADGSLVGHIVHIDGFGNLITDIPKAELPRTRPVTVEAGGELITGLSRSYGEGRDLAVLIGSSGYLEVACRNGSAAAYLKLRVGGRVRVRFLSDE